MAGDIFISYRRTDEPAFAGRLFDRFSSHFPRSHVYMDVDSIPPGEDFLRFIIEAIARCDVVLVVIGQRWLTAADERGRRLDHSDDFVRLEVETALRLGRRVMPVVVGHAEMPSAATLPSSLRPLARLNAMHLSHERFHTDAAGIIVKVKDAMDRARAERRAADDMEREQEPTRILGTSPDRSSRATQSTVGPFPAQAGTSDVRSTSFNGTPSNDSNKPDHGSSWLVVRALYYARTVTLMSVSSGFAALSFLVWDAGNLPSEWFLIVILTNATAAFATFIYTVGRYRKSSHFTNHQFLSKLAPHHFPMLIPFIANL